MSCKCAIHQYLLLRNMLRGLPDDVIGYITAVCFEVNATAHDRNYATLCVGTPDVYKCVRDANHTIQHKIFTFYRDKIVAMVTKNMEGLVDRYTIKLGTPGLSPNHLPYVSMAEITFSQMGLTCNIISHIWLNKKWIVSMMDKVIDTNICFTKEETTYVDKIIISHGDREIASMEL